MHVQAVFTDVGTSAWTFPREQSRPWSQVSSDAFGMMHAHAVRADVAGAALRILLRGADGLAPNMVAGVLARCARCGLDADLRAFAIAAALTQKAPPEIAAVAAVVQADPRLMESVLSASGDAHP